MSVSKQVFLAAFDKIETTLEFDTTWSNGTGYFDGARDVDLEAGKRAKSIAPDGRRLILVGTDVGTCVAFERYSPDTGSAFVVVTNVPGPLGPLISSGSLEEVEFRKYFYSGILNIGTYVAGILKAVKQ